MPYSQGWFGDELEAGSRSAYDTCHAHRDLTEQHAVRIADLGFGSTAARITSIRSLPDAQSREQVNNEDEREQNPDEQEDLSEQHVNLEVGFAYRGLPSGHSAKSKARNLQYVTDFTSLLLR